MSDIRFVRCEFCNNRTQGCEQCICKKTTFHNVNWKSVNEFIAQEAKIEMNKPSLFVKLMKS